MREKELRLALVCYGGISLAVYMHGITKEIWRLVHASRDYHEGAGPSEGSGQYYRELLETIEAETGTRLRVIADIIAGASAGGINGIFLAQAITSGQSLDPLTDLWLDCADVEQLLAPDARPISRFSKFWAQPLVWMAAGRKGGAVEQTVEATSRYEVRHKLSRFIRSRWFEPPFGGAGFTELLLNALEAMRKSPAGPRLLPAEQPLDLFVTVTDYHGHPERLRLNSPPEVIETEHRLVIGFSTREHAPSSLAEIPELVFAARATASFPGAFPPFNVAELDQVLAEHKFEWTGREAFLRRVLPRQSAAGVIESTALIDGSVLANAPFAPAIEALKSRPARREVDRRFVYIDPKPGVRSIRIANSSRSSASTLPGFFGTIFGALSDLPRTQPIRDNLEAIEQRSARIRRMREIIEAVRPEVEESIEALFGITLFLDRPTPARLAAWRAKAQEKAAKSAGHAYPAYGHLKLSGVIDEVAMMLDALSHRDDKEGVRHTIWNAAIAQGLDRITGKGSGATEGAILFFRQHDLRFRIRRLRLVARRLSELQDAPDTPRAALDVLGKTIYGCLALYLDRERADFFGPGVREAANAVREHPVQAIEALADARDLKSIDQLTDHRLAEGLAALPKPERRQMLLAYLGFPYYDMATLPMLQGEGLDEFDPIKVDRISPEDATTIRKGGAEATLKGIQFNSFGAFFSRAYRENDYLWGRLHGADRLIDIVVSSLSSAETLPPGTVSTIKHKLFLRIIEEEEPRLTEIGDLFRSLKAEIGAENGSDPLAKDGIPE